MAMARFEERHRALNALEAELRSQQQLPRNNDTKAKVPLLYQSTLPQRDSRQLPSVCGCCTF